MAVVTWRKDMKKSLFLILVLAGLSLLSLPLAVAVIGAGEDQIVIAQEVISGDKELPRVSRSL